MMRLRQFLIGGSLLFLCLGGGLGWAWSAGWFDADVHNATAETNETSPSQNGDLQEALQLAKVARAKLESLEGYRCIYLRDERIDNELQQNYMKLGVRHSPFSVLMEWVEPKKKQGQKVTWVDGKNNGKMRAMRFGIRLNLDPEESIKRKESRHTIKEAGLKNLANRLVASWEEESKSPGTTAVRYSDADVVVEISGKHHTYACRLVETTHAEETKGKYAFFRTKVYFDKRHGWPVRMEGYDWPSQSVPEGILLERFSYVEVNPDDVPAESDFQL